MIQVTDMETWMIDNSERVYRFQVYKKLFTPFEVEKKYIDETQYENNEMRVGMIKEAIDLGNGEWLIGIQEIIDDELSEYMSFFRFGDIQLSLFDSDQNQWREEE